MKTKVVFLIAFILAGNQGIYCQNKTVLDSILPQLNRIFIEAFNNYHDTLYSLANRERRYEIIDAPSLYVIKVNDLDSNLKHCEMAIDILHFDCWAISIHGEIGWFEYDNNCIIVRSDDLKIGENIQRLGNLNNFDNDNLDPLGLLSPCTNEYEDGFTIRPSIGIVTYQKSKYSKRKGIITFKMFEYIGNVDFKLRPVIYCPSHINMVIDSIGFYDYNISNGDYIKGRFKMPKNLMDKEKSDLVKYKITFGL